MARSATLVFNAKGDTITVRLKRRGKTTEMQQERFSSEAEAQKAMKRLIYGAAGVPIPNDFKPEPEPVTDNQGL